MNNPVLQPLTRKLHLTITLLLALPYFLFAQEATQVIRGTVIDKESREPLIGATVTVVNGKLDGGGVTDADGKFRIAGIPLGRKNIKVTYVGYETLVYPDVIVTAGKEIVLQLALTEATSNMNEVTISYSRRKDPTVTNNEMATISSRSFNPDETRKYAGAIGDPSRMAANFAGVIAGNDSRNDIVVRGNSPTSMLWQLEGVNIPNPNHFGSSFNTGGPVSMLNANNIAKSDFFTGAFPAQYGNAVGGVFDLMLREGNNERREYVAQVGFNGFEFGAEGPLSKKKGSSYMVNYRYSTIGLMKLLGANVGTGAAVPLYQDINFKFVFPVGNKGKIAFWGLGGMSSIDLLGRDVDTTDINFYGSKDINTLPRYRSGVSGVSYEKTLSAKTWARISLAGSHASSEYRTDSITSPMPNEVTYRVSEGHFSDNKISAVFNLTHKFNPRNTLHAGLMNDVTLISYFNKAYFNHATLDTLLVDRSLAVSLTQAYAQWKHRFGTRLTLNTGFHVQYLGLNNRMAFEPRAGLRYALNDHSSVNAGYGLHHQMLPVYDYFVKNTQLQETNRDLKFVRSNHFVLGYENMITPTIRFRIETYYQLLDHVPVEQTASAYSSLNGGASFGPDNKPDLVSNGTGRNYGAELTLERFTSKGFYFLITGSLFESKYTGSDGIERNTAFNTRYAANILGGKEFKFREKGNTVFYVNLKLTTIGGRYVTPLDLVASAATGEAQYDYSRAYSQQMAAYLRSDLKAGLRKDYKRSSMEFAVDFQNITDHKNIFSQGYNKYKNTVVYNYQQGFFPVPTFRFTF